MKSDIITSILDNSEVFSNNLYYLKEKLQVDWDARISVDKAYFQFDCNIVKLHFDVIEYENPEGEDCFLDISQYKTVIEYESDKDSDKIGITSLSISEELKELIFYFGGV